MDGTHAHSLVPLARKASFESLGSSGSSGPSQPVSPSADQPPSRAIRPTTLSALPPSSLTNQLPVDATDRAVPIFQRSASRLSDHFPQKTLEISQENLSRSASVRLAPHTPELLNNQNRRASATEIPTPADNPQALTSKRDETGPAVKFLPAYRGQTIEEMMQNRTPRPTWHANTKYAKSHNESTVKRSGSKSRKNPPTPEKPPTPERVPQRGRQTLKPDTQTYTRSGSYSSQQVQRYYNNTEYRTSPSMPLTIRRTNDGTHPRMAGPLRAITPQTYHGQPINRAILDSPYANVNFSSPIAQPPFRANTLSHPDVRYRPNDGRMVRPPPPNVRTANSENNLSRNGSNPQQQQPPNRAHSMNMTPPRNVPSKEYVASSTSLNNLQFAQLMTQPPAAKRKADSASNIPTRSSYPNSPDQTSHKVTLSVSNGSSTMPKSRKDAVDAPQENGRSVKPLSSPVTRQPSYLNAIHSPSRTAYQPMAEPHLEEVGHRNSSNTSQDALSHSDLSAGGSDSPITLREKLSTSAELQAKMARRTSYLMATSNTEYDELAEETKTPVAKSNNLKKLKNFFGEKTPTIKEAQEKAKAPTSSETYSLPTQLDVNKVGILVAKIVCLDSKRANDRSWKVMGAALCGHRLYLLKDKKENANALIAPTATFTVDDQPVDIKQCHVDIAYGYTKRDHVFRMTTKNSSEYMLQAENHGDMMAWIKSIMDNSRVDSTSIKAERLTSAELVKRINDQQAKLTAQQKRRVTSLPFRSTKNSSPSNKTDANAKKDKKRFPSGTAMKQLEFGTPEVGGDFGIPIADCTPSHENELVPLVVELCTKAIEEHGMETVGIYRVPGKKAAVSRLINELNQGVINSENELWRDMNVLSSLLKQFFRELPDSLITCEKYDEFIKTNTIDDPKQRLLELKNLLTTLPESNFETFKYLTSHLNKVVKYGETNKMDSRNLAIVFGPTVIHDGKTDSLSVANDITARYKIIETLILYSKWMFEDGETPPPEIDESAMVATSAPISETMNSMSADLAKYGGKKQSKSQLANAFTSAANKNLSKTNIGMAGLGKSPNTPKTPTTPTTDDDGGFKNRNLEQETAARNRKISDQKNQSRESLNKIPQSPVAVLDKPDSMGQSGIWETPVVTPIRSVNVTQPKWHSEESVLPTNEKVHQRRPSSHVSKSENQLEPPPLPIRGAIKPALPPKPLKLFRPLSNGNNGLPQSAPVSAGHLSMKVTFYENFGPEEPAKDHVKKNQSIERPLLRRGSLDSLMDQYEPPKYSDSDSDEESEFAVSLRATWDEKLKDIMPKLSEDESQPKFSSGSSSASSVVPRHPSSDQSRESLLSILSNKDVINNFETESDRGFDGSCSSISSSAVQKIDGKNVGIASRIERNDIKPIELTPIPITNARPTIVSAIGTVNEPQSTSADHTSEDEKDIHNNNISPMIQRRTSEEKKKIRRRHTVGGAADMDHCALKNMLSEEHRKMKRSEKDMNEANRLLDEERQLSAWQRLHLTDSGRHMNINTWLEKGRCRSSGTDINTENIMHLTGPSMLQTNT